MSDIENDVVRSELSAFEEVRRREATQRHLGWFLVVGGTVGALATAVRANRGPLDWSVSLGLVGAGVSVLLRRRKAHIVEAEEAILSELEGLDPLARAQVLKAVAQRQFRRSRDE